MQAKTLLATVTAALAAAMSFADVSVRNVTAVQRYPWNGLVDIDYEVVCDDADADVWVSPNGIDADRGRTLPMRTLSGDGANTPVRPGKHRMTWDAAKDCPGEHTQNFQVSVTAVVGASLYLVVDLSGGPDAESYPVRHSATGPDLADDSCRTSNMWFRLVPPGTFTMGSPSTELGRGSNENLHEVTVSKPFYLAIFECTQKQWELVMGSTPSSYKGDVRPVEQVSYNDLRGTLNGAKWPAQDQVDESSFFGKLQSRTALPFDLPTEAQWEYACRAGTTTALNSGKDLSNSIQCAEMAEVGRYAYNSGNSGSSDGKGGYSVHTKVGSYAPNAWGIYDMHGNVWEWCRDWYGNYATGAQIDPKGASSGSNRVPRGGCWNDGARSCRSACRGSTYPSGATYGLGFRPSMILPQ